MEHTFISERRVHLGDLILMVHKEHPTKSGWWRKMKDHKLKEVYYILERPIHGDYNINDEKLKETHQENDCFVIKANTISYEERFGDREKYNIILNIKGTDAINLVNHNYNFNFVEINSENVNYTKDFIEFLKYYNRRFKKESVLEHIANNCII
ncbi:hypothetical protein FKF97_10590 [Clostridium perfringens]|nr:hypothetical protein [Clostridium perfringens]